MYTSQWKQDEILDKEIFHGKEHGIFIDVGANDGILGSNSYFFETVRKWTGICIEPIPSVYKQLVQNRRRSRCIEACAYRPRSVSADEDGDGDEDGTIQFTHCKGATEMLSGITQDYHPLHNERIDREIEYYGGEREVLTVKTVTLTELCKQYNYNTVDFISIDTEGSELNVLKGLDLHEINVRAIVFENNYPGSDDAVAIDRLLSPFFKLYRQAEGDLIYVRR
jgi:FkbM family methyltransferase